MLNDDLNWDQVGVGLKDQLPSGKREAVPLSGGNSQSRTFDYNQFLQESNDDQSLASLAAYR